MNEPFPSSSPPIIDIRRLTRHFGNKTALDGVSLAVPRGGVFGLIGGNGAGKTTLIKHILGMLKAQSGTVQVFGLDPVENPVGTLGRIGYLSEERDLPNWMRVGELLRYTQAFFPTWDEPTPKNCGRLSTSTPSTVKTLSRGQRARAGLLVALAHRPGLLVLDEPSSGLDPVVRRDILGPSSARSPTRGELFSFPPTCSTRSNALPTAWRSSTRGGSCSRPQWMKSRTRIAA